MIKSGKFQAYVSFGVYPLHINIAFKEQLIGKFTLTELKNLRAVTKRAIQKAEQTAPSEEDKEEAKHNPLADDQWTTGG